MDTPLDDRNRKFEEREALVKSLFFINGTATNIDPVHRPLWPALIDAFQAFNEDLEAPDKIVRLIVVASFREDHQDAPPYYTLETLTEADEIAGRREMLFRNTGNHLVKLEVDLRFC
jgi:hypothetical protein